MKYKYCFELSLRGFLGCVWGGGGRGWGGDGGSCPGQGGQNPALSCLRGDKLPGFGGGLGQDKLLHRLKLDTDEETNHFIELSHNKCMPQ